MNLLSSIVPGIRELRSPLAAGLLWIAVIVVSLVTHHADLLPHSAVITSLHHITSAFSAAFLASVILTGAYLVGSVMMSVTAPLLHAFGGIFRRLLVKIIRVVKVRPFESRPTRKLLANLETCTRQMSVSARGLVLDSVTKSLGDIGVPGSASLIFPPEAVISTLSFSAPQLSQTAPTQYQEYDRARSEAEFRRAIVPPMVLLGLVAPVNGKSWIATSTVIAGLILLFQALYQERKSRDILANACYLGYVILPMVQAVTDYLSKVDPPKEDGEWMGAIIAALSTRAYFDASDQALRELTHFNAEDLKAAHAYLKENAPEEAVTLSRYLTPQEGQDDL